MGSSAEFKAKMTERFLKKQKLAEEEKAQKEVSKSGEKKTKKKDGAYYSDSDEESDDEVEKGQEVLEKLQSFAGDLWKDSDDEGESVQKGEGDEESSEEDGDDEEDDEEDDSDEDEEEDDKVARKKPMLVDPSPMIRYDPLSEGQEDYLRRDATEGDGSLENLQAAKEEEKPTSSYSVTSDLKAAFNSSKGFSFGFGKEAADEKEKPKEIVATGDWDAVEEADDDGISVDVAKKNNDDVAAAFGRQLRVKGVNPFFFTPNDSRLEAGLNFFFNQEVDMDKLRKDWDSKGRAVLVEILKKRARSKAAKAKAVSGKRKGQSQGWRRGGKKKQRL